MAAKIKTVATEWLSVQKVQRVQKVQKNSPASLSLS